MNRRWIAMVGLVIAGCSKAQLMPSRESITCWFRIANHASSETIAIGPQGELGVIGKFSEKLDLGDGIPVLDGAPDTVFVANLAPDGLHGWAVPMVGVGPGRPGALAFAANGDLLAAGSLGGANGQRCFARRLRGTDGSTAWSRDFGGDNEQLCRALALGKGDALYLAGSWMGRLDAGGSSLTSAGAHDMFLAELSADDGSLRWIRAFGGRGDEIVRALATDRTGEVILAGQFGGGDASSRESLVVGGATLQSLGGYDGLIARFSASGEPLWARRFGDIGFDIAKSVAVAAEGDIFVSGAWMRPGAYQGAPPFFGGAMDGLLMRWSRTGDLVWKRTLSAGKSQAHHLTLDRDGTVEVIGHFGGELDLDGRHLVAARPSSVYVASFRPDGVAQSASQLGSPGANYGYGIASREGELAVAGLLDGEGDFCGQERSAQDGLFLGRLR